MNNNNVTPKPNQQEMKDMLYLIRNAVIIVAIYLYFIGWVYINSMYRVFSIDLHSLDIPIHYFFVYSSYALGQMLSSRCGYLLVFLIFAVTYALLFLKPELWKEPVTKLIVLGMHIASFLPLYYMSKQCGGDVAKAKMNEPFVAVNFTFREHVQQRLVSSEFIEANKNNELILITQTKNRIYVFRQQGDVCEQPVIQTYDISKEDVYLTTIELQK